MSEEEVEITVTVPDVEEDANDNGIPDGIEIGKATVNAENALEEAESAGATADAAISIADSAITEAYDAREGVAQIAEVVRQQGEVINAQSAQIADLLEVARLQSQVMLSANSEPETRTPLPPEDAPESGHWLNRKII